MLCTTQRKPIHTNICTYVCTCVSTHIHTMPTYIGTCVCTEKHAHNCSFINVKGFRLLLQHYLINPICGAGEKQNRNMCIDKIPTRVREKEMKETETEKRLKNRTYLCITSLIIFMKLYFLSGLFSVSPFVFYHTCHTPFF